MERDGEIESESEKRKTYARTFRVAHETTIFSTKNAIIMSKTNVWLRFFLHFV